MNSTKFTLFDLLYDIATDWIEEQKKTKGSIVGNLFKTIEKKKKLRDAQIEAIKIYLWLKEVGRNKKLSELIKEGTPFINDKLIFYPGDNDYIDKPAKRYLNRYLQDSGIRNLDDYLRVNLPYEEYEKLLDNLFEDFNYTNYLFSLPMGAGKTFLIATFIYIDLYMYEKTNDEIYSNNFIIIAPQARKTAILPALKTIKLFNPKWILPDSDASRLKKKIRIEVLDEIKNADKLQNQNPNLAKIRRTTYNHDDCNVFILNAEKVIPTSDIVDGNIENLSLAQQTKIIRSEQIKDALSELINVTVFLDEAHHTYSSDTETKKLREQLDIINKNNNINCCIGMSGTPYINRKIDFNNKKLKTQDIQDIVYYYPLTKAIGNFLKTPIIHKIDANEPLLITTALSDFFTNYDIEYSNGTLSKIAFYCPSIEKLNEEILPVISEWYDNNKRDKSEILKYYTNSNKKYPLPSENLIHFLNLDNPTSKFRVVLLVAVGTEGWDCKSLTSVVLPREGSSKNLVLQTTCRCLREVSDSTKERALIYLDNTNFTYLDDELKTNYHLSIADINGISKNYKDYPVYQIKKDLGKIEYNNVKENYIEIVSQPKNNNYKKMLKSWSFSDFKKYYPFSNQVGTTTITNNGITDNMSYDSLDSIEYEYDFIDFIYELEKSSFGNVSASELIKYRNELEEIYKEITKKKNFDWIKNHPYISTYDICKSIVLLFASKIECKKETINEKVELNLLTWDMKEKPIIRVYEEAKDLVLPKNAYDDMEDSQNYDQNLAEIKRRFETKMNYPNKEKSFNYLPYKMDSSYEISFLENALKNLNEYDFEIYYNGYKNDLLESFRIETPYGKYTPDFLLIKRNKSNKIIKVLIIETKAEPYITESKEEFVKTKFLENNENYSYIRIGDTANDINEYNKLIDLITNF